MMRYPQLWKAVRTCWTRDPSEYTTLDRQLVDHANHILVDHLREELGHAPGPAGDGRRILAASSVNTVGALEIEGVDVPAVEIDTDPFVYARGAQTRPDVVTTVVIARQHLPYVRLAWHTRTPHAA